MIEVSATEPRSGFDVGPAPDRPPTLAQVAAARLAASSYPPLQALTCHGEEDVVALRGRVSSYYLKQLAQTLVSHVAGIREVRNEVEVVDMHASRPPRHKPVRRADRN